MNAISKLAVVFIIAGTVLLAGPAFGFSTISSDRGVTVTVASDQQNALLGIVDQTGTNDQIRPNDQVEILRLYDNGLEIGPATDIEASVVEFAGESDDGFSVSVNEENGEYPVIVECDGSDGGTGTMVFDLEASGTAAVNTTWETNDDVDVNCGGGGGGGGGGPVGEPGLNVVSVEPAAGAEGGVVKFEINNTASKLQIGAVSVDHANSNTITREMTIDGQSVTANPTWPTDGTEVDIKGSRIKINSGATATITVDAFDTDMNGESFAVTFVDDRGASDTTETLIVDVPCNAGTTDCSDTDADVVVEDGGSAGDNINSGGSVSTGDDSYVGGNINADDDVMTGTDSYVAGDVDAGDAVMAGDGSDIGGNVSTDGGAILGDDSYVSGNINGGGDVSTGDNSGIGGSVDTTGGMSIGSQSSVGDDISAGDDVVVGDDSSIDGNVDGDDITIGSGDANVNGNLNADGSVTTGTESSVNGDVAATETVTVGEGASVTGDITTEGDVVIGEDAYVSGNINAGGNIVVNDGITIDGDVTTSDTLVLNGDPYIGGDRSYESCDGCE